MLIKAYDLTNDKVCKKSGSWEYLRPHRNKNSVSLNSAGIVKKNYISIYLSFEKFFYFWKWFKLLKLCLLGNMFYFMWIFSNWTASSILWKHVNYCLKTLKLSLVYFFQNLLRIE